MSIAFRWPGEMITLAFMQTSRKTRKRNPTSTFERDDKFLFRTRCKKASILPVDFFAVDLKAFAFEGASLIHVINERTFSPSVVFFSAQESK